MKLYVSRQNKQWEEKPRCGILLDSSESDHDHRCTSYQGHISPHVCACQRRWKKLTLRVYPYSRKRGGNV